MARALDCGCAVAQAVAVGDSNWLPAVERSVGAAAVFVPPGTPEDGVLAIGKANTLGWTTAEFDPAALRPLRADPGPVAPIASRPFGPPAEAPVPAATPEA